jgi:hypothetical protein
VYVNEISSNFFSKLHVNLESHKTNWTVMMVLCKISGPLYDYHVLEYGHLTLGHLDDGTTTNICPSMCPKAPRPQTSIVSYPVCSGHSFTTDFIAVSPWTIMVVLDDGTSTHLHPSKQIQSPEQGYHYC